MKYLILNYRDEAKIAATLSEDEMKALGAEYAAYTHALQKAGVYVADEAVQPSTTAITLRSVDGKPTSTPGPFAETREQLAGFFLIECDNLDQAIAWAGKCPNTRFGSVEIRPILTFN